MWYLSHDGDGGLSFGLGHPVLDQIVHVLVIQESDQVEGAEAGCTAQGQVSDHHRAERKPQGDGERERERGHALLTTTCCEQNKLPL